MARPTNNIRKLTKVSGSSLAVIIPAELIRALGWHEKQRLIVKKAPRGVTIIDAISKKRK